MEANGTGHTSYIVCTDGPPETARLKVRVFETDLSAISIAEFTGNSFSDEFDSSSGILETIAEHSQSSTEVEPPMVAGSAL